MKCLGLIVPLISIISLGYSFPLNENKFLKELAKDFEDFRQEFKYLLKNIDEILEGVEPVVTYIFNTHRKEFEDALESAYNNRKFLKYENFYQRHLLTSKIIYEPFKFSLKEDVSPPTSIEKKKLENLMNDLNAVTDFKEIKEFWNEKLRSSAAYKQFHEAFFTEKVLETLEEFKKTPEFVRLYTTYEKYNLPLRDFADFMSNLFQHE